MAYQTATATDASDLLDKLRLFLLANGWTVDNWADFGAVTRKTLTVHKGAFFATFRSQTDGSTTTADPAPYVSVIGHSGYTSGTLVQESPAFRCNALSGPFVAYDFFEGQSKDGPYIHVVVETASGVFKHFGTGILNREGVYTSGQYVYAQSYDYGISGSTHNASLADYNTHAVPFDSRGGAQWGCVRADADGVSPAWHVGRASSGGYLLAGFSLGPSASASNSAPIGGPSRATPSSLTGRTALWPLWCLIPRPSGFYSPAGYPADMRHIRLDNYNPRDILTLGADQWRVFPIIRKNGINGEPNSGTYGYAFRVNA